MATTTKEATETKKKAPTAKKKAVKKATPKKSPVAKKPSAKKTPKKDKSDSFAIFATGGKQYHVSVGDTVRVEKLLGDHKEGDKVTFDEVLLTGNGKDISLGTPFIKDSKVTATIKKIGRAKKIEVIKYKSKSRYFKRYGHRQPYFEIVVDSIN